VGYREVAARLEAVAERKRRKRDAEIQKTRITIRGVRIATCAAVGQQQVYGIVCFVIFILFRREMKRLRLSSGRKLTSAN
jgi:hypothetical protein